MEESGPLEVVQIEWEHVQDVAQTCHRCCWVGCREQVPLPARKSLPPRSFSSVSKILPAKCFELPGTRCGTNSLIIVSNLQILGSVSGNTKKGMGLGRQKPTYASPSGSCLLRAFPTRDTKPLLLRFSKSYIFVCERHFLFGDMYANFFLIKQSTFVSSQWSSYKSPICFS